LVIWFAIPALRVFSPRRNAVVATTSCTRARSRSWGLTGMLVAASNPSSRSSDWNGLTSADSAVAAACWVVCDGAGGFTSARTTSARAAGTVLMVIRSLVECE
jgi:hypothetical protein